MEPPSILTLTLQTLTRGINMKKKTFVFLSMILLMVAVGVGFVEAYEAASTPTSGYITFSNRYHSYENDINGGWGLYLSYPINKYRLLPTPDEVFTTSDEYDSGPKTGYKWAWKAGYCGNWYDSLDELLPDGTWTSPTYIVDAGTSISYVRSLFDESEADAFLFLELKEVPISYSIYYDGNGATSGSMSKSSHTYDMEANLTENAYTRTGYTFAGWNTKEDGSGKAYANLDSVKNMTTSDDETVILYAQWKPNTYTIIYDGNGATAGSTASSQHTYDTEKALTANSFLRTSYTFIGWSTSKTATTASYTDGESVKNLTDQNGDTVTLYAVWKPKTTEVTFDKNDGSGATAAQSFTYGKSGNKFGYNTDGTPKWEQTGQFGKWNRTGYTLLGWSESSIATTADYSVYSNVTNEWIDANYSSITLYAVWKQNDYTVTYDANGGTTKAKQEIYHYKDEVALSATAQKAGYTFVGWSTDPDARMPLSEFAMPDLATSGNKDYSSDWELTLYAVYSIPVSDVENHTYPDYTATAGIEDDEVYLFVWLTSDNRKYKCYPLTYEIEDIETDVDKMTYTYKLPKKSISSFVGSNAFAYQIIAFDNAGNSAVLYEGTSDGSILEEEEIPKVPQYYNQRIEFYQYDVLKDAYSVCENIESVNVEVKAGETFSINNYLPTAPSGYKLSEIVYPAGYTVSNNSYTVKEAATIKVYYAPIKYKLAFNVNLGGKTAYIHGKNVTGATGTITYGDYYANVAVSGETGIPTPECEGYVFNGWNTKADGSGPFIKGNDIYQTAGNTTVYAQWTPHKLTIHYHANGGSISDTSKGYPIASDGYMMLRDSSGKAYKEIYYNITDTTVNVHNMYGTFGVIKTGYHLVNGEEYRINNPGTGTVIDDDAESVETFRNFIKNGNASITLYSNWQANAYTIKYNANGGTGAMDNTPAEYDTPVTLSPNGFEREGYTFIGWSTTKTGTKAYDEKQTVSNLTATNNGTVTLYAVWSANSYQVEYDYQTNGGTTVSKSGEALAYGTSIYTNVKNVTSTKKDAYGDSWTHVGWNIDQAATTAMNSNSSWICTECGKTHSMLSMPAHDITLYAIYKKDVTATFIDSVPAKTTIKKVTLYNTEVSKSIDIPAPTEISGWKAYGWSTAKDAGVSVEYSAGATCELGRDMTFYALYERTVCVSYDTNGSAQTYATQQGTRYYNSSGFYKNPTFKIADVPVLDDHSFVNWSISGGPVQNKSGTQIENCSAGTEVTLLGNAVLKAVWDKRPEIEAYDRYFTLEQAQNGEVTEEELLAKVKGTDKEDGMLVNGTDVVVKDFKASDFSKISKDAEVEITYQATDSFGNVVTKTVTVIVTDTNMKKSRIKSYVRFISPQFFKNVEGAFIDAEQGGLERKSVWRCQESYVDLLEKALFGVKENAEIWTFTNEELKKMKKDL